MIATTWLARHSRRFELIDARRLRPMPTGVRRSPPQQANAPIAVTQTRLGDVARRRAVARGGCIGAAAGDGVRIGVVASIVWPIGTCMWSPAPKGGPEVGRPLRTTSWSSPAESDRAIVQRRRPKRPRVRANCRCAPACATPIRAGRTIGASVRVSQSIRGYVTS